LAFVRPDGVYGSSSVHLPNTPITIVGVDFSADTVDARFFGGLDAQVVALPLHIRASGHGRVLLPNLLCNVLSLPSLIASSSCLAMVFCYRGFHYVYLLFVLVDATSWVALLSLSATCC
jgi:hypothetical protein